MNNQAIVLAAGKGSRMGGEIPKVLVNLNNKPLIMHVLSELNSVQGLDKPVIVVGFRHEAVRAALGSGFTYALQEPQLGTGHAVMVAKSHITSGNFLVLYGDMPFIQAKSLQNLLALHHQKSAMVSMFTATVPTFEEYPSLRQFGRIVRGGDGGLKKIVEFKDASTEEREVKEVNPGIYVFNSRWLYQNIHRIKNDNAQAEYYLTDMIALAQAGGHVVYNLPINPSEVLGINTLEELKLAETLI